MKDLFGFIAVAAALYLIWHAIKTRRSEPQPPTSSERKQLPYKKKDYILTRTEKAFFDSLILAVGNDYHILSKIRMLDLFFLPARTENRKGWTGRIIQKHTDFVLCNPKTMGPVLAIELDDSSHDEEGRQERDKFVDHVFESGGLPLLHVRAASTYPVDLLKTTVQSFLAQVPKPPSEPPPVPNSKTDIFSRPFTLSNRR